jgi:hypothetical protein
MYAEGKWDAHLERFAELPAGSMIFHLDRTDPLAAHRILGAKFCLSGGLPNALLAFGSADDVKAQCRRLIETIGADGGYIMDASAIIQNDATIENLRAMTDATLEYGIYRSPSSPSVLRQHAVATAVEAFDASSITSGALDRVRVEPPVETPGFPAWITAPKVRPGICFPFEKKLQEMPPVLGDIKVVREVWENIEGFAYLYIWHVLLSF